METFYHKREIEIWGGVECTIVRVKNQVHDQLEINGHEKRDGDLALLAGLGITKIRYPMLWEKYVKDPSGFFELHRKRLAELKTLEVTPIAGLLHHGSGPFCTDLLDPDFPEKLAGYAGLIASEFPFIEFYTPVNEPLTTARFSGLYGIWYPHRNDDHSFATMFLNEMKGIILAMHEIRKHNPEAKLIQTEDLCRIHSTETLKYQADFENQRRWLTYDILNGLFNEKHPMWGYFLGAGIPEQTLLFFQQDEIRPFICGFNYYVTSERFLDEKYSVYPPKKRGGNGRHRYADVECVRVEREPYGSYKLLREAWDRYRMPMVLSEVHLGCTREEQMRWLMQSYHTALQLRKEGVDFRAITAWSVLGAFGWNTLLRRNLDHYEPGVFDLSSGIPRPTALAHLIKKITRREETDDPLLKTPGWWNRDIRISYSHKKKREKVVEKYLLKENENDSDVQPLLIIGGSGSLGNAFTRMCELRGIVYVSATREMADITSEEGINKLITHYTPWAVVNAAGYSGVDEAEKEPIRCFRENTMGAIVLAKLCERERIRLITFSTDQVFNGRKRNPYIEKDITAPLNTFGLSKRMAEERILAIYPKTLVIRSSMFFNPWNQNDNLVKILSNGREGLKEPLFLSSDIISSPAYVPELVNKALDLLIDGENGIWHLSSNEGMSVFEFTRTIFDLAGLDSSFILPVESGNLRYVAERPSYSVLMSSRGISLPPLEQLLQHFLKEFNRSFSAAF